jgi:hypothetical protein
MPLFTYFLKSINVLNLLLIAAAASLAVYLLYPALNVRATYKAPAVAHQTPASKEEHNAAGQNPPLSDYTVVAEQNIFHPERKIPPDNKDEKDQPRPEIFLYGTLLTDNMRLAYIEDKKSPQSSPGRGNRQTVVKQGDSVSGFLVKSVETDRIVLVKGEEQIIVLLNDIKKARSTVTPTQPTGIQPGTRPGTLPGTQAGTLPTVPPGAAAPVPPRQVTPRQTPTSPAVTSQPQRQPSRPPRTNPTQFTNPP